MPGVTLTNAPDAFASADDGAMFLDGQDHVLAATGVETTAAPEEGAEDELVTTYQQDQQERETIGDETHEAIVEDGGKLSAASEPSSITL